jgi:hypothetical protein
LPHRKIIPVHSINVAITAKAISEDEAEGEVEIIAPGIDQMEGDPRLVGLLRTAIETSRGTMADLQRALDLRDLIQLSRNVTNFVKRESASNAKARDILHEIALWMEEGCDPCLGETLDSLIRVLQSPPALRTSAMKGKKRETTPIEIK